MLPEAINNPTIKTDHQAGTNQNRQLTVNEVSTLCGISKRTLHYYDQQGLLTPSQRGVNGYRFYSQADLLRLQQILFFRELDFSLKDIAAIMESPGYDASQALRQQQHLLTQKRDRLNRLLNLIERILKGEQTMSLKEFDQSDYQTEKEKYAQEVKDRWGKTDEYKQSQAKTNKYDQAMWTKINAERDEIFNAFAAQMAKAADSPEVIDLVRRWQDHITTYFYICSDEMLLNLSSMYTCDERFRSTFEQYAPGLTDFISQAIQAYCQRQK